ncbi:S-layer homology domain-containing protein [Crassaminicella profunda]|uniref:S-layer homology domain-containing protein n=1 Tax=Crassaminicella profunda TaxID=1286698 RepID=UPI001CA6B36A|nr:S-layer homology domain-containing protein [Crassaminicella profunda]QZY54103.1 S-layer homology domain-containing protein [Crassaminicella profunda]
MKKILAIILIMSLIIPTALMGYADEDYQEFSDIKGHWAEKILKKHHKMGMLSGYPDGTFKPDQQMKRSELITLVNKYFGLKEEDNQNFEDVEGKEWYANETAKAKYYGYIKDLEARPEELASREDVVNMMSLIIDVEEQKQKSEKKDFKDLEGMNKEEQEKIESFSQMGYVSGYEDGTFKPKGIINRAEIMSIVENMLGYIVTSQEDIDNMPEGVTKVTIINPDIVIENKEIKGDIYIAPGVNGRLTIKNTKIKGQIDVSGGTTKNPIKLENVDVEKIVITKVKDEPKVEITGKSNIGEIKTKSVTKIEIKGETKVKTIQTQEKTEIKLEEGTKVEKLITEGKTKVETEKGSEIVNLEAKEKTEIKGEGKIDKAEIESEDVSIEKRPGYVKVDDQVDDAQIGQDKMDSKNDDDKENENNNNSGGSSNNNNNDNDNDNDNDNEKDTTPPEWATGYPFATMKSSELKIELSTKLNEKGTVYYTVYEAVYGEDITFTVAELISDGNSYGVEENTVTKEVYNGGLSSEKTYNIYLTAVDEYNNKQSSVKTIKVSAIDTTKPVFTKKEVKAGDVLGKMKLTAETNESANIYYVVVEKDSTSPTVEQIKAGVDYDSVQVIHSGNKEIFANELIEGLEDGKTYDIYLIAEDKNKNVSTIQKISYANIEIDHTPPTIIKAILVDGEDEEVLPW